MPDECQIITNTHRTNRDILCDNQIVLIKQGNLHASSTDIDERCVLADNLMEIRILRNQSLEADITLFRVTQNLYTDTCGMLDHIQHQIHVICLTYRTRRIGTVFCDLVFFHFMF